MCVERTYKDIKIIYRERCVQIVTDKNLMEYLNGKSKKDSLHLAEFILMEYESIFHKNLQISVKSLSVEILIHAYLDELTKLMPKAKNLLPEKLYAGLKEVMEKIHVHTAVIDCGEAEIDSNRKIFDSLAGVHDVIALILE